MFIASLYHFYSLSPGGKGQFYIEALLNVSFCYFTVLYIFPNKLFLSDADTLLEKWIGAISSAQRFPFTMSTANLSGLG